MRIPAAVLVFALPLFAGDKPTLEHLTVKPPAKFVGESAVRVTVGEQRLTFWPATKPGQLFGVVTFAKPWTDFRGQEIPAGAYTLRSAKQPKTADHEDTSPSPDFLILSPIADDRDPADLPFAALKKLSGKASGGNHPAVMVMLPAEKEAGITKPKATWMAAQWTWNERPIRVIVDGVWNGK